MSYYRNQSTDGSWSDFFGDIYSGVVVGINHPIWWVERTVATGWNALASLTTGGGIERRGDVKSRRAGNETDDSDSSAAAGDGGEGGGEEGGRESKGGGLKVVGVGYGRTGTYSLALALDELGFPTLHTQHLYENGEIFDHLVDNIFRKSILEDEILMGDPDGGDGGVGDGGVPNFDLLLDAGFAATMDLPFALYFDRIMEQYPDCKFILTTRKDSDVWFRSWNVLTESISKPAQYTSFIFAHVRKLEYYMRWLFSVVNDDKKFLSSPFPLPPQNKERAVASYERHNQLVRDTVPPSRLLEYSVREGWEPLCRFLEIEECPTVPFPKSNSARAVRWQSYSAFIFPALVSLLVISSLLAWGFRKFTGMSMVGWCRARRKRSREARLTKKSE